MKTAIILALAASALSVYGQLPDAPKPHIDKAEIALLAADAGARALDVYSTHQMLQNGNRELFLPKVIASHPATMAAFSGGMVAMDYFAARRLERHRHKRMAHLATMIDAGSVLPWAIHNLYLPDNKRPTVTFKPLPRR